MLNEMFLKRLENIDWFKNAGHNMSLSNQEIRYYERVSTLDEMYKGISSNRWDSKRNEEISNLTSHLFKHSHEKYNKWNTYVDEAKRFIDKELKMKINSHQEKNHLPETFVHFVVSDITLAIMVNEFLESEGVPKFYLNLIDIYESGHIPCGWVGKMDKGILKVF